MHACFYVSCHICERPSLAKQVMCMRATADTSSQDARERGERANFKRMSEARHIVTPAQTGGEKESTTGAGGEGRWIRRWNPSQLCRRPRDACSPVFLLLVAFEKEGTLSQVTSTNLYRKEREGEGGEGWGG